jgi:hypothetical protein
MRRIDVIGIGLGVFAAGGILFAVLRFGGLDASASGLWTQAALIAGLTGWLVTYLVRAATGRMTYHQQRQELEDAVLQKRFEELTPEQLAELQAELDSEETPAPK